MIHGPKSPSPDPFQLVVSGDNDRHGASCPACGSKAFDGSAGRCPNCGADSSVSPRAPGAAIHKMLATKSDPFSAACWLLVFPHRAFPSRTRVGLPFAPVSQRLLPMQILLTILVKFCIGFSAFVIARAQGAEYVQGVLIVMLLSGVPIVQLVIELSAGAIFAAAVMRVWEVRPRDRRPGQLAVVMYSGLIVASSVEASAWLTACFPTVGRSLSLNGGNFPIAVFLAGGLAAYVAALVWNMQLLMPVTPTHRRGSLMFLIVLLTGLTTIGARIAGMLLGVVVLMSICSGGAHAW